MDKAIPEDDITGIAVPFVQHNDHSNDEQEGTLDEKYCDIESCTVTVGYLQNAGREGVVIRHAIPTRIASEKALTFGRFHHGTSCIQQRYGSRTDTQTPCLMLLL